MFYLKIMIKKIVMTWMNCSYKTEEIEYTFLNTVFVATLVA